MTEPKDLYEFLQRIGRKPEEDGRAARRERVSISDGPGA